MAKRVGQLGPARHASAQRNSATRRTQNAELQESDGIGEMSSRTLAAWRDHSPMQQSRGETLSVPPASFSEVISDRYQLGEVLGRGGMGEVRAATDLALDRDVAVKFLRDDLAHERDLRRRFEREARAAARITDPHVVAIYDIGEHGGVPYIVMERLSGSTLANEFSSGALNQARACSLVLEVLAALDAAHRLGVIHRDIKPGNILLTPDGHAKVADFGIAKLAEDSDQTTTGMLFGTAAYLAPERLAGRPATRASDLYSVGVVLFEALAGHAAFTADTPLALVESISRGVAVPLAQLRDDVAPAVVAVVERAMAKDPDLRFQSASTMAAALASATRPVPSSSSDLPTVPVGSSRAQRVASTPPTDRVGSPNAPATLPTFAATEVSVDERRAAGPARHLRLGRRAKQWLVVSVGLLVLLVAGGLFAAVESSGSGPAQPPSSSTASTGNTIPGPLQHAIDQLDKTVRP
jgi:serine/threonine protein kinase